MDQEFDIKNEAKKQYLRYFRFWFIGAAVLLAAAAVATVGKAAAANRPRGNRQAPKERVYDYADVLTAAEEQQLREQIALLEKKAHADFVLVTLNLPMGLDDAAWERNMMTRADDLYENADNDYASYGWDKPYGDGALLLDNWYEDEQGSQKGSWLSTSGKMERIIGAYEEGKVFDAMDPYIDSDPFRAYEAALTRLGGYGDESSERGEGASMVVGAVMISTIAALIYALANLKQSKAKDTTTATTYVPGGQPVLNVKSDDFLRKNVVKRRIETSSGGGGGGSHHSGGGSYGSHSSSSGHSHGGGGRRR